MCSGPSGHIYSDGNGLHERPRWQRILRFPFFYREHRRGGSTIREALRAVKLCSFTRSRP